MIPSYAKEIERLYKIREIQLKDGREHISWSSKLYWKNIVKDLGCPVAEVTQISETLKGLVEPDRSFVLKPEKGSVNRGIFVCEKTDRGWKEYFSQKILSWDEIVSRASQAKDVRGVWFIEEFLGVCDNWEFYCFGGRVGLIRQRKQKTGRNIDGRAYKFYRADWEPLGKIQPGLPYDLGLSGPEHPWDLLRLAETISLALPFVFCRVDLYDTPDGVYYGEASMHPGPAKPFEPEIDRMLGQMWLEAEAGRIL